MDLFDKIDMFLMSEATTGVSLSVLAKSELPKVKGWDKASIDQVVSKMTANVKDDKKYEIAFIKKFDKKNYPTEEDAKVPLVIYRKDDDVIKSKITNDVKTQYKKDVEGVIKGTGMKITGEMKMADWVAFIIA